jgi:hypothetical protein
LFLLLLLLPLPLCVCERVGFVCTHQHCVEPETTCACSQVGGAALVQGPAGELELVCQEPVWWLLCCP